MGYNGSSVVQLIGLHAVLLHFQQDSPDVHQAVRTIGLYKACVCRHDRRQARSFGLLYQRLYSLQVTSRNLHELTATARDIQECWPASM